MTEDLFFLMRKRQIRTITDVKRYNQYMKSIINGYKVLLLPILCWKKITLEMEYLDYNGDREYLGKEEIIDDVGELENRGDKRIIRFY